MKIQIFDRGFKMWISQAETYAWNKTSHLAGKRVFVEFDDNGLCDYTINGRYDNHDYPDLDGLIEDFVFFALPEDHYHKILPFFTRVKDRPVPFMSRVKSYKVVGDRLVELYTEFGFTRTKILARINSPVDVKFLAIWLSGYWDVSDQLTTKERTAVRNWLGENFDRAVAGNISHDCCYETGYFYC